MEEIIKGTTEEEMLEEQNGIKAIKSFTCRKDGVWSWIMCALFFLCNLFVFGCATTYGILFPDILKEFGKGRAVTAMPGSLASATSCIFGPFVGPFCDRYGCRKAMIISALGGIIGLVLSSFAPHISVLIVSFGLVLGIGLCFLYIATMTVVPVYFEKYRFQATSIVGTGHQPALIVMTPIVQQLNQRFGWRKTILYITSFSAMSLIIGCLMRDENKTDVVIHDGRKTKCSCKTFISFEALKIKVFVLVSAIGLVNSFGHQMPFVHIAKFCDDLGISSEHSSWLYFTIGLSSTISRLLVGKFGKKGCLTLENILLTGILLLVLGDFMLPSANQYHWLVVYSVNYGIGDGLTANAIVNIAIECLPDKIRGGGYGLFQFFCGLGYTFGPILSGLIADITGSYNYVFYIAGVLELLGGFLWLALKYVKAKEYSMERPTEDEKLSEKLFIMERETVL